MARYLRTSKQSKSAEKGLYLQIYESNHVPGLGSRSQLVKQDTLKMKKLKVLKTLWNTKEKA